MALAIQDQAVPSSGDFPLRVAAAVAMLLAGWVALLLVRGPRPGVAANPEALARHAAVVSGLDWLLSAQEPDGSWDPARWGGQSAFRRGLTGLAVVTLAATPDLGARQRRAMSGGAAFLARPSALPPEHRHREADIYNQGLAALALVEAAAKLPNFRPAAEQALRELRRRQQPDGGWGYAQVGVSGYDGGLVSAANASATTWPLRAFQRARELGWSGAAEVCARGERWLVGRRDAEGRVGYRRPGDHPFGWKTLTAMAHWLAPQFIGPASAPGGDLYGAFFHSRAQGHSASKQEADAMARRALLSGVALPDRWRSAGGKLYSSCFALLTLNGA
jgi:hypothetical protein